LNEGEAELTPVQARLWEAIRIYPTKWAQHPHGDNCAGFWVVAIFGKHVIWFNDIEDGFNISSYQAHGAIADYWANQDTLGHVIQRVLNAVEHGWDLGPFCGPPQPIGWLKP
jgi:hypothetical protein